MYLQNIDNTQIDANIFMAEILTEVKAEDVEQNITEQDIENGLAELYVDAADATAPMLYASTESFISTRRQNFSAEFAGRGLWRKLIRFLCKVLNATSTAGDILAAILDFIVSVIPGGIVFKGIIKKILKYFLNKGYNTLCPVE
ncbi:hypothetical protein AM493_11240 [Flavobacterium akiainvivens]|uniref:Uncharacterized protein n=1 Tax=Flavobacterium akiainvivens TaxID=1202724 RepID=A0A0M8MDH1_9FLAO|nr:hypothetical protein [Flavobacterium akiainvivens]KOS06544.1 hypothetical protein AM493_11240 [Flavobacterium akiainvivens]SFQ10920.1 hypothetical protein SAMN05444144_101111 [Flavobacterium akiainvivens]